MRKQLLASLALAITACSTSPSPSPVAATPGALRDGTISLQGRIVDYAASDGATLYASTAQEDPATTAPISLTGEFKITVPVPRSSAPLNTLGSCGAGTVIERRLTVTPDTTQARLLTLGLATGLDRPLTLTKPATPDVRVGQLFYVDQASTMSGQVICGRQNGARSTTTLDLSFAKGWNFVLITSTPTAGDRTIRWPSAPIDDSLNYYIRIP